MNPYYSPVPRRGTVPPLVPGGAPEPAPTAGAVRPPPAPNLPAAPPPPGPQVSTDYWGNRRKWGGRDGAVEEDVKRYTGMARDTAGGPPVIDETRSNESRGMVMGSLGRLERAATGQDSMARELGTQQARSAADAQTSMAASVRGGPMARAAAARAVNQGAGSAMARQNMAINAAAAGEQAAARGAYASGAGALRGADLGLASSKAGLEMGDRAADDQKEGFFEGLAWDTKNADMAAALGLSASDAAAAQSARSAAAAADAQTRQNIGTGISTAAGGIAGAVGGVAAGGGSDNKSSGGGSGVKYGYFESDVRAKTAVQPFYGSDSVPSDVMSKGDIIPLYEPEGHKLQMSDAGRAFYAADQPDAVTGASLSGPVKRYSSPTKAAKPKAEAAKAKARKLTDEELLQKGREMLAGINTQKDAAVAAGPSVRSGDNWLDHYMTSDAAAKQAAFKDGVAYADRVGGSPDAKVELPAYMPRQAVNLSARKLETSSL